MAPLAPIVELSREEQTEQSICAIAMSNRLSVAEIRLNRADQLSDGICHEMKEIRESIANLTDSLILGEDVGGSLKAIENRVMEFEQRIEA